MTSNSEDPDRSPADKLKDKKRANEAADIVRLGILNLIQD